MVLRPHNSRPPWCCRASGCRAAESRAAAASRRSGEGGGRARRSRFEKRHSRHAPCLQGTPWPLPRCRRDPAAYSSAQRSRRPRRDTRRSIQRFVGGGAREVLRRCLIRASWVLRVNKYGITYKSCAHFLLQLYKDKPIRRRYGSLRKFFCVVCWLVSFVVFFLLVFFGLFF